MSPITATALLTLTKTSMLMWMSMPTSMPMCQTALEIDLETPTALGRDASAVNTGGADEGERRSTCLVGADGEGCPDCFKSIELKLSTKVRKALARVDGWPSEPAR